MNDMKHYMLLAVLLLMVVLPSKAVKVTLTTDAGYNNPAMIETLQTNLAALLSEINAAYTAKRNLNLGAVNMDDKAKAEIATLWDMTHFYVDEEEVVDRCWPLKNSFLVRQIPLILDPDGDVVKESTFQEASVTFDRNGRIDEFRFALDAQLSESMEKCGDVISAERKAIILQYVERFRTAYCRKDLNFMNQVFSDDALIITGKVVQTKPNDMGQSNQKVVYNRQTKQQYLANLKRAFQRNKYIEVKFSEIGDGGDCGAVTQSRNNPNFYGVRLRQEWRSSNYSDDGYVFLLWDFRDESQPVIHVRTWQPTYVNAGTKQKLAEEDIFNMSSVEDMIH
jgi:ketosteroid isomerase-like protein